MGICEHSTMDNKKDGKMYCCKCGFCMSDGFREIDKLYDKNGVYKK